MPVLFGGCVGIMNPDGRNIEHRTLNIGFEAQCFIERYLDLTRAHWNRGPFRGMLKMPDEFWHGRRIARVGQIINSTMRGRHKNCILGIVPDVLSLPVR